MTKFTSADQEQFARLSGDFNPLHMDPIVARRSQFGRPLVHGVHLICWALNEALASCPLSRIDSLLCVFRSPVGVGEDVEWATTATEARDIRVSISSYGAECCTIRLALGPPIKDSVFVDKEIGKGECHIREPAELGSLNGAAVVQFDQDLFGSIFPILGQRLPLHQLATLLATTRIIGMECPGYYSLFTELKLETRTGGPAGSTVLKWQVDSFDERFHQLVIGISSSDLSGSLTAFARNTPQIPPALDAISSSVSKEAYKDRRAIVIGGSRGLGEICAKLLAAGGADVSLSYHQGRDDADRVVADILKSGGTARAIKYNVLSPPVDLQKILGLSEAPTHIYYFATPAIFIGSRNKFSMEWFNVFCRYYVEGFYACWKAMRGFTKSNLVMFYPSSVAVEQTPASMGEYAAAKAAGENLCRYLTTIDKNLVVKMVRLPRLPSDQTLSVMDVEVENPIIVLRDALE